jgi:hypothetical protein
MWGDRGEREPCPLTLFFLSWLSQNSCWFDLSPSNISKKLGTKSEINKLVHMVFAVAKQLEPSVIYMDEVEQSFQAVKGKKSGPELVKMKNAIMVRLGRNIRAFETGTL